MVSCGLRRMTDTGIWADAAANTIMKMCPINCDENRPESINKSPRRICRCKVPTKMDAKILTILS